MTPFGDRIRQWRRQKGLTLKAMAAALEISPAYLSALEHGRRGRPSRVLLIQMTGFLDLNWDQAEELERLAELSHPRVVVETAGLSPLATECANRLARRIGDLSTAELQALLRVLDGQVLCPPKTRPRPSKAKPR